MWFDKDERLVIVCITGEVTVKQTFPWVGTVNRSNKFGRKYGSSYIFKI